ncbi:hypothetical protein [Kitasatospora sp. NPDC008115]|uniref:hypothetical protein n=1 Tax=Kitasatospora sp. NPDC008115 TaxID=3364022 RepID=UPI0036EDA5D8
MTSPADTAAPRPADSGPGAAHRPAAWVRTRLRAAPLAALLAAVLAFGTVFLAAAFPRLLDRTADQGLRDFLHDRGPAATSILATADLGGDAGGPVDNAERLDSDAARLAARTGLLGVGPGGPVYGARSVKPRLLTNPGLARPDDADPAMDLLYVQGLRDHVTLAEGNWPGTPAKDGPVPIAISRGVAETVGIHLGDILKTASATADDTAPLAQVVGIVEVADLNDPYWSDLPCPDRACLNFTSGKRPAAYWHSAGLVDASAFDRIRTWQTGAQDFWRLPVDVDGLRADRLHETGLELSSFLTGDTANALANATERPGLRITSQLPTLFERATARQEAAAPLSSIGPAGLAGVGVVVLCLAAALAGDRRIAELRLLQARGGSRAGVVRRLLAEGAVTVLPAAALATALAFLLLPTPRWGGAALAATAVALFSLLALPLRAARLWSRPRPGRARRRVVGELAVLGLTIAAVAEVRRRGVAPVGEGADPLLVAAPLLLALTGGLLLARLQPLLLGTLARASARRPGAIGFLGLARAARGSGGPGGGQRPSVLPLLALLLAVTTAGFGATILGAVDTARTGAARLSVGGDASVVVPVGVAVSSGFADAAGALPGVRASARIWADTEVFVLGGSGAVRVFAVVADPTAYAEISRSLGRGAFDPAALSGGTGGPDAPVPALLSTELAERLGPGANHRLRLPNGGELLVGNAGTVDSTPALQGDGRLFVVLPAAPAIAVAPELDRANLWLATGSADEGELRKLVREKIATGTERDAEAAAAGPDALPAGYTVRTSVGVTAELGDDPLQRSAGRLFWTAVLGAGSLALLAVLLTLVRAAPERTALLARLRTMGLRPRQGLTLILVETLPQTLVAAVGGGLVALGAVALLGPSFDLSILVGADIAPGLPVSVPAVLLPTVGLAALVSAGIVAEALIAGRRQITTELRAGDQR